MCFTQQELRKIDCFNVYGFCGHCQSIFEALGCFYQLCECHEVQNNVTNEDIVKGHRKREMDILGRYYLLFRRLGSQN